MGQGYDVLISGAGSGIGRATARVFSSRGYSCLLLGRDPKKLKMTLDLCPRSLGFCFDLEDLRGLPDFFDKELKPHLSSLRILINNAGQFKLSPEGSFDLSVWQSQMNVNFFSALNLTNLALAYLKENTSPERARSAIVNVSSTLGLRAKAHTGAYSTSKAAMNLWTEILALELAPFGIRVNALCPGLVDTPIHDFHNLPEAEKIKKLAELGPRQPLGRVGDPQEIAESIFFLATEASRWTTGSLLKVDGGIDLA